MTVEHSGDRAAIAPEHLETLRELLFKPHQYAQRVVERVNFLPQGGERWRRDVQTWVPPMGRAGSSPANGRFVLSLGMFRRKRFPDFTVVDGDGTRLPLLTRHQHQHCMTMATLGKFLPAELGRNVATAAPTEWRALYLAMGELIADVAECQSHDIAAIKETGEKVFRAVEVDDPHAKAKELAEDCEELLTYTHYLCWVPARWGDVVSLSATYTMEDTVRIAGAERKSPRSANGAVGNDEAQSSWQALRMRSYTRLGLCPVYYGFQAGAHDHAGSYYFTVEPPDDAHVSLLDWGSDHCFGSASAEVEGINAEVDHPFPTCHIHNGQPVDDETGEGERERNSIKGAKIAAFLKADPVDNAAVMAIAILNLLLAYLAQGGAFLPRADGQLQWILIAPAILVALIAQHRARYYSEVTGPLRAALWSYLGINAIFGASVAFDVFEGGETTKVFGVIPLDDLASGGMFCVSLGLISLLTTSGGLFERTTRGRYESQLGTGERPSYLAVTRHYADQVASGIGSVILLAAVLMFAFDWGGDRRREVNQVRAAEAATRNPTWPANAERHHDYDVFLAYNADDRVAIERLAALLRADGIEPLLANERILPDRWSVRDVDRTFERVAATAIAVGSHGLGGWHADELQAFVAESAERGLPTVPLLLPDAAIPRELDFLSQPSWIQFRESVDDARALELIRETLTQAP